MLDQEGHRRIMMQSAGRADMHPDATEAYQPAEAALQKRGRADRG
jgi:hypothetical protein